MDTNSKFRFIDNGESGIMNCKSKKEKMHKKLSSGTNLARSFTESLFEEDAYVILIEKRGIAGRSPFE